MLNAANAQLFVALHLLHNYFRRHMHLVNRLLRQHRLADDVADDKDVLLMGAHLDIDVDEATIRYGHVGLFGCELPATWW